MKDKNLAEDNDKHVAEDDVAEDDDGLAKMIWIIKKSI